MPTLRYVTVAELVNEIPENVQALLTDDGITLNSDEGIITAKLAESEKVVESYTANRYELPLIADDGTVPEEVKGAVLVIAKFKLYSRRDAISREILESYNATMKWLKDVTKGYANIVKLDASGAVVDAGSEPSPIEAFDSTGHPLAFDKFV